jgi:hypothetical protein
MVKCGVLFEVRIEILNINYMSFGFIGLITYQYYLKKTNYEAPYYVIDSSPLSFNSSAIMTRIMKLNPGYGVLS